MININISIGYQNDVFYKNCNFKFPDHGIISFVGENGSGKSTIYKTLLGMIPPVDGKVPKIISSQSAVVSDYISIPEEISVNNLLELLGKGRTDNTRKSYPELHDYVSNLSNQKMSRLSSGQKRCVEIYSVLASGKKVIFLDEASNGLDFKNKSLFLNQVRKLSKQDILFFHTSHDLDDVSYLAGDIYALFKDKGEIDKFTGNPDDIQDLRHFLGYGRSES
ncbi:MAG: ATP-binding cassette domain-containing protein [Enterococcaceae bacterium]|jgi:ABC-type multidrug transport system ATPase subunit|nr:ATP-binding cassette domain-containing protein [Enterococcaceae bacterium]